jgi:hypothetical protein
MQTTNADDFVLNELARLRADLEANQERLRANEAKLEANQERLRATQRRLKATWAVCSAILLGGLGLAASPTAQAQFGITLASLNTRLTAVENKTTPLSYNSTTKRLTVTGANVMIIDGTGATESTSGLGNLQVGYNALRGSGDVRTGSHNLIVGDQQNYSNSGGLVAGVGNTISGLYASVSGGGFNTASSEGASVSGGSNNTSSNFYSAVSGGINNTASGNFASVSAGLGNRAGGAYASISGGALNRASGNYASISAGENNQAIAIFTSVSGGNFNIASGNYAAVSGGGLNISSGISASILGGNAIGLNINYGTYPAGP